MQRDSLAGRRDNLECFQHRACGGRGDAAEGVAHIELEADHTAIDQGIDVLFHCGGGGFKSQMKKADASGAAFAVIIGDDEAIAGEVTLKPLRASDGVQNEQKRVSVDRVADEIMNSFLDWEEK